MDDAGGVRGDEDIGDLLRNMHPRGPFESPAQRHLQRAAFDELEDEPVAVFAFDVVVDPTDVRMIELREDLGFAEEPRLR